VPNLRTPRELLIAALERRRLTGYRASRDHAWVLFPPQRDGEPMLEVLHLPRANRFRVVSSETRWSTAAAATLGDFVDSEAAAACVAEALTGVAATKDGRVT
jgi:hypothetical protein